jgi:V/A-type H+-transporting ATPase subunit G/H
MAKEAIEAIKSAEDKAKEIINEATQASRDSLLEAKKKAEEEYKNIIDLAETKAKEIKDKAIKDGEEIAKPIIDNGSVKANALNQLDNQKLESAVNIILERIVNPNGNS